MAPLDSCPATLEESQVPAEVRRASLTGHFALTGEVIASSFGSTVFLGADRTTGAPVAVKVVQKPQFEGPEAEEELQRSQDELRVHAAVPPHPHVLQLLLAEETPSSFLLVTPFVTGGVLWDVMKYGQTCLECEVRNCATQLLSALRHVHACGLVHGDLKPQNLLLEQVRGRYWMRLCDFGLARYVGDTDGCIEFTGLYGTPGWLAPEQILETDFGRAVDLFACGLIFFMMLGGYEPFEPAAACLEAPAAFDERYWGHIGADCRRFVAVLLSLNPEERSTAGALLEHPWCMGPPPTMELGEEVESRLAASGGMPSKEVCFWSAEDVHRQLAADAPPSLLSGELQAAPALGGEPKHSPKADAPPALLSGELQAAPALGGELKHRLKALPCH